MEPSSKRFRRKVFNCCHSHGISFAPLKPSLPGLIQDKNSDCIKDYSANDERTITDSDSSGDDDFEWDYFGLDMNQIPDFINGQNDYEEACINPNYTFTHEHIYSNPIEGEVLNSDEDDCSMDNTS